MQNFYNMNDILTSVKISKYPVQDYYSALFIIFKYYVLRSFKSLKYCTSNEFSTRQVCLAVTVAAQKLKIRYHRVERVAGRAFVSFAHAAWRRSLSLSHSYVMRRYYLHFSLSARHRCRDFDYRSFKKKSKTFINIKFHANFRDRYAILGCIQNLLRLNIPMNNQSVTSIFRKYLII